MIIAFLLSFTTLKAEESPQYTNSSFARLNYVSGKAYLQRAADLGYEEAVVNMPISEGDRLGTTDGRAEVYLGKGNYVRLDHNTKIDFLNLPKKDYELVRIKVWAGNVYFRVKSLKEEKNIEIHTSDVSVYALDKGLYRIDVRQNSETEIFVFSGMLEAAGITGSVLIKDGQRLEVSEAKFTSSPSRFYAVAEDSFDRWSESRDSQIRTRLARAYLPEELEDFENELADYGDWIYIPPYGNVWVPGDVDQDWRPYYYGRWNWLPLCGWTWVPYEPWGWCTFHFGRWNWLHGIGWYWIPRSVWGPAWVSWYWGYDYFGWVPLSYYDYPGVIINNVFYSRYSAPHYPSNSKVITVIHKNQLKARNISSVALSEKSVKNLGEITLSSLRSPQASPKSKISVETLGGEKLILRKAESSPEPGQKESLNRSTVKMSESQDSKLAEKTAIRGSEPSQERKIVEKKSTSESINTNRKSSYGYPSSPEISIKKYSGKIEARKLSSSFSQIYRYISGRSKSSGGSSISSQRSSSKIVSSSSGSRSSSRAPSRSSSSSSRSSRSSSGSGKVKKK